MIFLGPSEDSSISNILIGIGLVTVILIALVIIIKLIQMCYKMWREEDNDNKDQGKLVKKRILWFIFVYILVKKSPLLPTSSPNVARRTSLIRNPAAPIHRSSLNAEFQMEVRQKRLSQTHSNTPPMIKKT